MKIFNTMSRKKETFVPLEEGKAKIYVCGPTVYDYIHLGNARPLVCFDILRRYLEHLGYDVTYVQNYTDIDDKLINRAREEGTTVPEIAQRFIEAYEEDSRNLGVKPPTITPRATGTMDAIVAMINTLLEKGYAYVGEDAIYYDVSKNPRYGRLSGHELETLRTGEREQVYQASGKDSEEDFALWKFKRPGEPSWPGPGPGTEGRPGWHIECSAMIQKYLGDTIDIHAGGQDLIFPHHENEIAQSEVCHDASLANYWMHNAHINIDGVKLSKSLGNSIKLRDLAERWTYPVLRFFIAESNYRSTMNVDEESLKAAGQALERVKNAHARMHFLLEHAKDAQEDATGKADQAAIDAVLQKLLEREDAIYKAMDDDLNTADALSECFILIHDFNQHETEAAYRDETVLNRFIEILDTFFDILGVELDEESDLPQEVRSLLEARQEARASKDWAASDRLRDEIQALGYQVRDTAEGQQCSKIDA